MRYNQLNLFRFVAILTTLGLILGSVRPPVYAQGPQPPKWEEYFPIADFALPHVGPASPAASTCCGVYDSGNPYVCCCFMQTPDNSWLCQSGETDYIGNCVWYAHYAATWLPNQGWGCPNCWIQRAQATGFSTGTTPRADAVIVWPGGTACGSGCSGHVAYVVRDLGNGRVRIREQGCYQTSNPCVTRERDASISGATFIYPPGNVDTTKPNNPTSITSSSHTLNQWSANQVVSVQWSGATDPGDPSSGIGGYSWAWTQDAGTVPDEQQEADENTTQTASPPLGTGQNWYFHVRARDKSNNWANGAAHYGPFWIDASSPTNPTWVQETHGAPNAWQNTVNDPAFTWGGASDSGSGIAHYKYYWGEDANGTPANQTTSTSFDPPAPCAIGQVCVRYLRLQTTDVSGRSSQAATLYTFRYDGQPPTGTFQINNGSTVAFQVAVQIHVSASDVGSDLYQMRLSNDGFNWPAGWQAFETDFWWLLDAMPNVTQTVRLELRNYAGNVAALPSQSIRLDLSGGRPRSTNYQIFTDVQACGGGTRASAAYSLNSTLGQVVAGNGATGQLYQLESGFQGAWLAQPSGPPPVEHYQLLDSVIGQGGGHKLSQNYQMNSTAGQSTQTGERSSANYTLTSGFWGRVINVGQSPPTSSPTPEVTASPTPAPTITPTVTPTPPPPPEFYGISINQASLFTHDYRVMLYLDALDAVEMMVSNDGGFSDAYWEAYAVTKTWEIDFYQNYVLPRTVYVRYRDASGTIHGNFTDDIIYDPNLPTGTVSVASVGTDTVSLNLELQDDLSGVSQVLVATDYNLETAQWETYAASKTVAAQPGDVIYVYYRDAAGNESLYPFEIQVPGGTHNIYLPLVLKNSL